MKLGKIEESWAGRVMFITDASLSCGAYTIRIDTRGACNEAFDLGGIATAREGSVETVYVTTLPEKRLFDETIKSRGG